MNSPIKWVGGKRKEIKYFKKYIPEFNTYVEPFVGGGAVFWELCPESAVINDVNEHLINFYNVLKNNPKELYESLQDMKLEKEYFKYIVRKLNNKEYNDNVEQASIFFYLNKTAFSGKWRVNSKGEFNSSYGYYKTENFKKLDTNCSNALINTSIENKDYKDIINRYKYDESAFIFLDPPYLECDSFYTSDQNFENIYVHVRDFLVDAKCKVMMVVKENDYINDLFKEYIIDRYNINYRHNAKSQKIHTHVVIANY